MNRRQEVIEQIKKRIASISPESGYDWKPKAFEWMVSPLDYADLPAVIIRDRKDEIDHDSSAGSSRHRLHVEIELYTIDDDAEPERVRAMADDLLRAIAVAPFDESGVGDYFELGGVEIEIEKEEKKVAMASIDTTVTYHAELWRL